MFLYFKFFIRTFIKKVFRNIIRDSSASRFNRFTVSFLLAAVSFLLTIVAPNISASTNQSPRLVIIIDDLGNNYLLSQRAARINGSVTLSILPSTSFGPAIAELGHGLGKEIMLHLPMSNTHAYPLGKGGLYSNMKQDDLVLVLRQDLNSLPYIKGLNNHMGSQLTQERLPMEWLMGEIRSRGLYFVDSRTTDKTLAYNIARQEHVPALKRDIFLDDDLSPIKIREQLQKALNLAKQRGFALAIGHPNEATLEVIEQSLGAIQLQGISIVAASELLERKVAPQPSDSDLLITSSSLTYCPILPYFAWPKPKPDVAFSDILHRTLVDWLTVY